MGAPAPLVSRRQTYAAAEPNTTRQAMTMPAMAPPVSARPRAEADAGVLLPACVCRPPAGGSGIAATYNGRGPAAHTCRASKISHKEY